MRTEAIRATTPLGPCIMESEATGGLNGTGRPGNRSYELQLAERALLAERLFLSLDAPLDEDNLRLWVAESERRLSELRAGVADEVPAEDVLRRARAAIK